jgi:DNA-binding XRE family transcriptional regulator
MPKVKRIHRQRKQTPEQQAEEKAIREKFQKEKPSLRELIDSGDLTEVSTMGDYWEIQRTFAALKSLREEQGLSITDMCERTGMDRAAVSRLENGQIANPTINTMNRYARALGKRVMVSLADES